MLRLCLGYHRVCGLFRQAYKKEPIPHPGADINLPHVDTNRFLQPCRGTAVEAPASIISLYIYVRVVNR